MQPYGMKLGALEALTRLVPRHPLPQGEGKTSSYTCRTIKLPSPDVGRRVGDEGRQHICCLQETILTLSEAREIQSETVLAS
jgi:hypothetical protein